MKVPSGTDPKVKAFIDEAAVVGPCFLSLFCSICVQAIEEIDGIQPRLESEFGVRNWGMVLRHLMNTAKGHEREVEAVCNKAFILFGESITCERGRVNILRGERLVEVVLNVTGGWMAYCWPTAISIDSKRRRVAGQPPLFYEGRSK